jgi:hypothetical protein
MVTGGELLLESAALRAIVRAESRVTDEVLGKGERRARILRSPGAVHVDSALTPAAFRVT